MDKRCQEVYCIDSITVRLTRCCYTPKPNLEMLNPKRFKFIIHDGYVEAEDQTSKSSEFGQEPATDQIFIL
ncbi:MAG: hypothetical protein OXC46_03020 [Thaumarchaeota archaeon]|nr:hypothetical protein [Nitrososphaerota archaeon]